MIHRTTPEIHDAHTLFIDDKWHSEWKVTESLQPFSLASYYKKLFGTHCIVSVEITPVYCDPTWDEVIRIQVWSGLTGYYTSDECALQSNVFFDWEWWRYQFNQMTTLSSYSSIINTRLCIIICSKCWCISSRFDWMSWNIVETILNLGRPNATNAVV